MVIMGGLQAARWWAREASALRQMIYHIMNQRTASSSTNPLIVIIIKIFLVMVMMKVAVNDGQDAISQSVLLIHSIRGLGRFRRFKS